MTRDKNNHFRPLRNSAFRSDASYDQVLSIAERAKGADAEGYRAEFIHMVEDARSLGVTFNKEKR